jgi:hypothetical protein
MASAASFTKTVGSMVTDYIGLSGQARVYARLSRQFGRVTFSRQSRQRTKMFRKLYWVTELVYGDGSSQVTGIYTSIPDLLRKGLDRNRLSSTRLTLSKLDSAEPPLGSWSGRDFDRIQDTLQEFVRTDEFSAEHCQRLVSWLGQETVAAR